MHVFRAARDTEALEREIAMLSERYGEAAAEAKANGKALLEKEALLDAVTAQVWVPVVRQSYNIKQLKYTGRLRRMVSNGLLIVLQTMRAILCRVRFFHSTGIYSHDRY